MHSSGFASHKTNGACFHFFSISFHFFHFLCLEFGVAGILDNTHLSYEYLESIIKSYASKSVIRFVVLTEDIEVSETMLVNVYKISAN